MDSIEICNLALNMLGINSIVSFDEENNNNAELCRTFFPVCRDRVLRDHAWSFASARFDLTILAGVQSLDEALPFVCAVPGDCIAVRELLNGIRFRCWGKRIMVESLPATLIYTRRVEDPSEFDVSFCEALQYSLASEIGMSNTRSQALIQSFKQEYERKLAVARSIDSRENRYAYQKRQRNSSFIASRSGNVSDAVRDCCGSAIRWVEGNAGKQVQ